MTDTFAKHFDHVEIKTERDSLSGRVSIHISPIWKGVDRPDVGGWAVGAQHEKLAARLGDAVTTGKAFGRVEVRTDVNGQTYVSAEHLVIGRHMNADLRRLGF